MTEPYFICTYTNKVKDYCDKQFIDNLYQLSKGNPVYIIDNTKDVKWHRKPSRIKVFPSDYFDRLKSLCNGYSNFTIEFVDVSPFPRKNQFHRNIEKSVNRLREIFLQTSFKKMLIVESDVVPPIDLLDRLDNSINKLPSDWGMLGGLYYDGYGFHDKKLMGLQRKPHVLSGCTVYRRELIEKYPFRFDENDLKQFPDALISFDSNKEFSLWDDHDIICKHLHNTDGSRYSKSL